MWELIQENKRKSMMLFIIMGICLIMLGFFTGSYLLPDGGGAFGIFFALIIWSVLSLISYFSGGSIMLAVSDAREVTREVSPQLFNVVEEMKIASNLPKMPKIYIINDEAPNAFATGRDPENSAIAVTAGLLTTLNRDELQGVIAHEMGHIINRDIRFITFAGIMIGSIVLISEIFFRSLWISGGSSRRYSSKSSNGGQAQIVFLFLAVAFAILAPIFSRLLYFAISRKREYLADATAARLTRYPEGLASALEKIAGSNLVVKKANSVTAPMYISNPLKKEGNKFSSLMSTHPPIEERIKILRSMAFGVNYNSYQDAYLKINPSKENIIPLSGLKDKSEMPSRNSFGEEGLYLTDKEKRRALGDTMMKVENYTFLNCDCGITIKIPPNYISSRVKCPRCGAINLR